jgi:hypothetical protein
MGTAQAESVTVSRTVAGLLTCSARVSRTEMLTVSRTAGQDSGSRPEVCLRTGLLPLSRAAPAICCGRGFACLRCASVRPLARAPGCGVVRALPLPGRDAAAARRSARPLRQPAQAPRQNLRSHACAPPW